MADMIKFDLPKNQSSIIKVLGVGGGGSNAVNHMFKLGIQGVDFILCNTDAQALASSPIPNKIQLGTKGLGAGSKPEVGKQAAIETLDEINKVLEVNTKMLFITAGMGGGTGTGAAPIIAQAARELGILTVGIVTIPFKFEGRKRREQAMKGIEELDRHVDTLLIISNDKLRDEYGNLKLSEAFGKADDVLTIAARGIAEIITVTGYINVDFEDVKTVMKDSGKAIMGSAYAEGEDRALKAIDEAMRSPLLNDNNIAGAENILLYIGSGKEEISMDEVMEITDYIQEQCGNQAEVIWGNGIDEQLDNKISVTIIATGFRPDEDVVFDWTKDNKKTVGWVDNKPKTEDTNAKKALFNQERETETPSGSQNGRLFNPIKDRIEKMNRETLPNSESRIVHQLDEVEKISETKETESAEKHLKPEIPKNEKTEKPLAFEIYTKKEVPKITEKEKKQEIVNRSSLKDDLDKKSSERITRLKELSMKLRTPQGLVELENQPAYIRKNVELTDGPRSSESTVSRYSLDNDGKKIFLNSENSFLHDNVD